MATRKVLAIAVTALMAIGVTPSLAQQANGIISGRADDEAKKPYSDFSVHLRSVATGQIVGTEQLNDQGRFSFNNVGLNQPLLVELVKGKDTICTEGPYALSATATSKTNVNIDCGKVPMAAWLLAAGAGTAAAIGLTNNDDGPGPTINPTSVQSPSQ